MSKSETLTSVLNKLHAMHAIGMISFQDVAKQTGYHRQDVSHWVKRREHSPNAVAAFKLMAVVGKISNRIAITGNRGLQTRYRSAYRSACDKFPVDNG